MLSPIEMLSGVTRNCRDIIARRVDIKDFNPFHNNDHGLHITALDFNIKGEYVSLVQYISTLEDGSVRVDLLIEPEVGESIALEHEERRTLKKALSLCIPPKAYN